MGVSDKLESGWGVLCPSLLSQIFCDCDSGELGSGLTGEVTESKGRRVPWTEPNTRGSRDPGSRGVRVGGGGQVQVRGGRDPETSLPTRPRASAFRHTADVAPTPGVLSRRVRCEVRVKPETLKQKKGGRDTTHTHKGRGPAEGVPSVGGKNRRPRVPVLGSGVGPHRRGRTGEGRH